MNQPLARLAFYLLAPTSDDGLGNWNFLDEMLKDAKTYQIMDPEELGLSTTLPLGKHSGRHAFRRAVSEAGLHPSEDELAAAFARFKRLADAGANVSLTDAFEEVAA